MLTSQAKDISLGELHREFNLRPISDQGFFDEWRQVLPTLSAFERSQLARVQQNYVNLSERAFSEEAVKMVVLSPLLDLADLYRAPFELYTEESASQKAAGQKSLFFCESRSFAKDIAEHLRN
ncbi:MAG: hypothetical protein WA885_24785 [Phormidesmis sp.]